MRPISFTVPVISWINPTAMKEKLPNVICLTPDPVWRSKGCPGNSLSLFQSDVLTQKKLQYEAGKK